MIVQTVSRPGSSIAVGLARISFCLEIKSHTLEQTSLALCKIVVLVASHWTFRHTP